MNYKVVGVKVEHGCYVTIDLEVEGGQYPNKQRTISLNLNSISDNWQAEIRVGFNQNPVEFKRESFGAGQLIFD